MEQERGAGELSGTTALRVRSLLDLIANRDEELRAIAALQPGLADDADRLDHDPAAGGAGPLSGRTVVVKDNIVVAGTDTTAGSVALSGLRHPGESPLIGRLRRAGALLVGKATMSEWAGMRSLTAPPGWNSLRGQGRNPLDPARSAWGSSSGCAAAIAAGYADLALGTDTSGSVLLPAAATGTFALRPTGGSYSLAGTLPLSPRQDEIGPMAATLDGLRALHQVLGAPGASAAGPDTAERPLRVAAFAGAFTDYPGPLLDGLGRALDRLRARGVELREGRLAGDAEYLDPDFDLDLLLWEFGPALDTYLRTTRRPDGTAPDLHWLVDETERNRLANGMDCDLLVGAYERFLSPDPDTYRRHLDLVTDARRRLTDFFDRTGADVAMAVCCSLPPALDAPPASRTMISTIPGSLAGFPQMAVPEPLDGGLPAGLLLIARPSDEAALFRVARLLTDQD